jgi:hypothetical protein
MAVVGDNIPGCTGTGEANNPYIYSDANGFIAAVGVLGAYVEADTANKFFDFNSVSYTLPIEINCLSLKAKNTTLFNVLSTDGSSIIKFDKEKKSDRVIDRLNIYNFCMLLYSTNAGAGTHLFESAWMSSDQVCLVKCTSCNFAGVVIGYSATTTGLSGRSTLIGHYDSSINYYSHVFVFENCTFNVHLKELARPILSFSEEEPVANIWEKLLEKKEHISIIIDEYGSLRGIVTLEDVIETMLGFEIVDEKDEVVDMQELAKAQWKKMQKEQHK